MIDQLIADSEITEIIDAAGASAGRVLASGGGRVPAAVVAPDDKLRSAGPSVGNVARNKSEGGAVSAVKDQHRPGQRPVAVNIFGLIDSRGGNARVLGVGDQRGNTASGAHGQPAKCNG